MPASQYTIGVDLGGTNLRAAAITRSGQKLDLSDHPTMAHAGREAIVSAIVKAVDSLRERHGRDTLAGIGIGLPGFISFEQGIIRNCNNLAALENFPIREELSSRLGTPVILENDANAAALGEAWRAPGQPLRDLLMITLGTGIGGGIVSGGRILRGADGMAGEIGHITVVPGGNPCGCGNSGCLEKHASASAVSAQATLIGLGDHLTSLEVFRLARSGDPRAVQIFNSMGEALGAALAMLINVLNFPLYVIGGGAAGAWDYFAPAMLREADRRSFTYRSTRPRIERARLGDEAGLYGAALLPWL